MGPTPLSVSGALREYSLRLLSQFLIGVPRLLDRKDRVAHPAQPPPRLLGPLGRTYPEPERHRYLRLRPDPPQELYGLRRQALPHPGNSGHGDAVDETRRQGHGLLNPRLGRGRRQERAEADAAVGARLGEGGGLVHGEVRYHEPGDASLGRLVQEALSAPGEDGVVVEQENYRHPVREPGGEAQAVAQVGAVLDGAGGGVLDRRPVRERVRERDPYLKHVGPGGEEGLPHPGRALERRVAARQVRHEGRPALRESTHKPLGAAHEGSSPASRASMPSASATTPMSLSPRPERLTTRFLPCPSSRATFSA